jgi:hypothetical protein
MSESSISLLSNLAPVLIFVGVFVFFFLTTRAAGEHSVQGIDSAYRRVPKVAAAGDKTTRRIDRTS